jgi:hypothetical protein
MDNDFGFLMSNFYSNHLQTQQSAFFSLMLKYSKSFFPISEVAFKKEKYFLRMAFGQKCLCFGNSKQKAFSYFLFRRYR